jgi:hypothetical protein
VRLLLFLVQRLSDMDIVMLLPSDADNVVKMMGSYR